MNHCYVVNHMRRVLGAMMLIGLVCTVPKAHAQAVAWSAIAAGCPLESDTVLKDRASTSSIFGSVSYSPGSSETSPIRFTCPVSGFREGRSSANELVMTFIPPTPPCQGGVKANLLRTNLNELERGNTIATVTFGVVGEPDVKCETLGGVVLRCTKFVRLPETFDFDTSYYWVAGELSRANTSCNPTMVGVHLRSR